MDAVPPGAGYRDLVAAFPVLAALDESEQGQLREACQFVGLAPGTVVFEVGQPCARYVLVTLGSVRVHLLDADGHEIILYRVGRGETCILTTAALLGAEVYTAHAVTERVTQVACIPAAAFDRLMAVTAR